MADHSLLTFRPPFMELKWDSRAGPILLINFKTKKLGIALFCHRKPERSFTFFGHTSLVCSRCTGISLGVFTFATMMLFHYPIPFLAQIVFILPMLIDGFSQLLAFRQSNNILRFVTGFLFSIGFLSLLVR
jgi:uncharacterized membrane protein